MLYDIHDGHGQDRDLTESHIRDCLMCGIINNRTRSHLLKKADLTLAGALDICHADEAIPTTNVGNNSTHNNRY